MVKDLLIKTIQSVIDIFKFSVLTSETRACLFSPVLPSLVRICEAFPPLAEDTISLLMQIGRVCVSQASLGDHLNVMKSKKESTLFVLDDHNSTLMTVNELLCSQVQITFKQIIEKSVFKVKIY